MTKSHLSPRTRHGSNPDHHIWNNNGIWWCHFTVHHADHTKERVRLSLHTHDRGEARRRRDLLMRAVPLIAAGIPRSHPCAAVAPSGPEGAACHSVNH